MSKTSMRRSQEQTRTQEQRAWRLARAAGVVLEEVRTKIKRKKIPARRRPSIPRSQRFRISAEITTALLFLHQTKPESLVRRDLKPANILLDRNILLKVLTSPPPTDSSATRLLRRRVYRPSPFVPASPPPPACPCRSAPIARAHRRPHRPPLPSPHRHAPCHAAPPQPPPWPGGTCLLHLGHRQRRRLRVPRLLQLPLIPVVHACQLVDERERREEEEGR
ncbi:Os04g0297933 [Oryza sativa Japonica Group]|uniref:RING-type E3 ubiquitin transferase n=1 Tax=Oryza sativa subsp. japonica TaxID=39947 RepID=A0A0P0W8W8_ORYSJ|nr:hypothetical protein EE612_022941 [Oryza sativa]BAS88452.1 Os04g0297933 [Oryza sativa Japonica Group]